MSTKAETSEYQMDGLKWAIVLAILAGGIYANSYYATIEPLYRALAGVVIAGLAFAVALQTEKGAWVWELAKEARVEVRKVVWPTSQETTQTTLIVVAVVIFVALILWALDSGLSWGVAGVIG
ncbi:MAG: preprotein translocase subunit SecE [Pseudomonadales bacterium]|nr:preprotein translocase subunit SecE [Pseudomonadales bacterium]MBO6597489.1 preprotein translocase subunit SecE [Pseudomonadales bacterium]MBO6658738.1 preprotein translocase subunit SecE [Pseudomonadales bacterium]MBO6704399.1 preprotein translocase subunit SecE [Pseudomonadales bacterium]MBO6824501.1 preprotein translocase subunit SecE [Pseudomonadales bacterium]